MRVNSTTGHQNVKHYALYRLTSTNFTVFERNPQVTAYIYHSEETGQKTLLLTIRAERNKNAINVHACDLASYQLAVY